MKKVLSILLVMVVCLSVVGCETVNEYEFEEYEPLPTKTLSNKYKNHFVDEPSGILEHPDFISNHSMESVESKNEEPFRKQLKKINKFYISEDAPDFEITDFEDGICINRYIGDKSVVEIPETIGGKPVLKLGLYAYQESHHYDYNITHYLYYDNPFMNYFLSQELKNYAEYNSDLEGYIADYDAFASHHFYGINKIVSVNKIIIPKTVKYIGNVDSYTVTFEVDEENECFSSNDGSLYNKDGTELFKYDFSQETYELPEGTKIVYNGAIGVRIDDRYSINIPQSVTSFNDVIGFSSCVVDENNQQYKSVNGSLLSKDGKELICANSKSKYKVPESVEVIKSTAFASGIYRTKILVGKNVKKIDKKIFNDFGYDSDVSFIVDKENKWFSSKKGSLYNKDGSILLYEPSYY